jgi:hypothetical protein
LKKAGARVGELDRVIALELGEERGQPETQADILVELAGSADLFRTPDDEIAYADLEVDGHRETWAVRSRGFRRWLLSTYWDAHHGAPHSEALKSAIGVIEAKAVHAGSVHEVYVRVGRIGDTIYLDLGDEAWRAVEVDGVGWRIADRPAARFQRSPGMLALPEPERDGSVDGLRPLLNIRDSVDGDRDFVLAIAFLLGCLRGRKPYPVLGVTGEQGTAKSMRSELLRSVIDPREPALRAPPRDEHKLVIAARRQHVLAFDNLSRLSPEMSDAFCRLSSGTGLGTRLLYTDDEESVFKGARPIILTGIEDFIDRPDLADRNIASLCELITDANRRLEDEIRESFHATHAGVLSALLDAVVTGLRRLPDLDPPSLPRLADFAHWAIACEPALWKDGTFGDAYDANVSGMVERVLEASPVAVAVRAMMDPKEAPPLSEWTGTAAELLAKLDIVAGDRAARSKYWPQTPSALSGRLRRAASFLRRVKIDVAFVREGRAGVRTVVITRIP